MDQPRAVGWRKRLSLQGVQNEIPEKCSCSCCWKGELEVWLKECLGSYKPHESDVESLLQGKWRWGWETLERGELKCWLSGDQYENGAGAANTGAWMKPLSDMRGNPDFLFSSLWCYQRLQQHLLVLPSVGELAALRLCLQEQGSDWGSFIPSDGP